VREEGEGGVEELAAPLFDAQSTVCGGGRGHGGRVVGRVAGALWLVAPTRRSRISTRPAPLKSAGRPVSFRGAGNCATSSHRAAL
jgi:hypothetical protein